MKKQEEALKEMQERFNFLNQDFMEGIEKAEVFFEDCENCDMKDECPNRDEYGVEGKLLEHIHEVLSKRGIDSNIHPMTSKHNGKIDEVVCRKGGVVPVNTIVTDSGPICTPDHNFLLITTKDGKELLYNVDIEELDKEKEENKMMYW